MPKPLTSGSLLLIASMLVVPPLHAKPTPVLDEVAVASRGGVAERAPIKLNADAPLPAGFDDGDIFVRGRFTPDPTPNPTQPADALRHPN